MIRSFSITLALTLALTLAATACVARTPTGRTDAAVGPNSNVVQTAYHDFRIVEVARGLVNPHALEFTPDGDLLVTERPGRLRIIRNGVLLPDSVPGLPPIQAIGRGARALASLEQAGLRDVVLHPDFTTNRLIYLSYVKPGADSLGSIAVVRGRFENDRLTNVQEIFHAQADGNRTPRASMWGGRLAFDRERYLYLTLGDRQWPATGDLAAHPAQQLANHNGTTVRLHDDGRVPVDNPFVNTPGARPEIWTYGHRNAQGLAVHPVTGDVWSDEHGPQGGDEVNLLRSGANYGWPVVGHGVNYTSGRAIHEGTHRKGMEPPVHVWVPSIGVSGMLFYTGNAFPAWKGDLLVGGMSGQRLVRLRLDGQRIVREEDLLRDIGRVRDLEQGPDGRIYLALDGGTRDADGPPTPSLRLEPAGVR
ncbi:MAG: PQQ-dependent sugar dehydrogenase [Gemmatimonadaceae bacterium]|nr:PQQ-dependent sugar dehydrogenase [Gemmatimonadaceae bacterium]